MKRRILVALGCFGLVFTLAAGVAKNPHWNHVPEKDHARANPMAGNPKAVAGGAAIYRDHCAQCHGADAKGDGKKTPSLKTENVRSATDGDLEWFLRQGDLRRGMPSWSSLPQAQRWQIVAYLRSLQQ
jgi:cytochrome c oxidase cbb3-type subunit 2